LGKRLIGVTAGWLPDDLKPYPYDAEKAKALLSEASFPMDQPLILDTPVARYLKDKDIAQVIAAQLGRLGLKVQVQPFEWSVFSEKTAKKTIDDLYLVGYGSRLNGLQDLESQATDSLFNPGSWSNAEYDQLFKEATSLLTPEQQRPIVQKAIRV